MQIKPLLDRVLVSVKRAKAIDDIALPDAAVSIPMDGVVESVGPLVCDLKAGTRVYIPKFGGQTMKLPDGREMVLIRENDCLGVDG